MCGYYWHQMVTSPDNHLRRSQVCCILIVPIISTRLTDHHHNFIIAHIIIYNWFNLLKEKDASNYNRIGVLHLEWYFNPIKE